MTDVNEEHEAKQRVMQTALAEVSAIHGEYIKHLDHRQLIIGANITAMGVLLGLAFVQNHLPSDSSTMAFSVNPLIAVILAHVSGVLGLLYAYGTDHMFKVNKHIRTVLGPYLVEVCASARVMTWWSESKPTFVQSKILHWLRSLLRSKRLTALVGSAIHPAILVFVIPSGIGLWLSRDFLDVLSFPLLLWAVGLTFNLALLGIWVLVHLPYIEHQIDTSEMSS